MRRDDSEVAALPAVGFGPVLRREEGVRCGVHRLQCSAVYKPLLARAGALPHPQLYISLRPSRWTGARLPCPLPLHKACTAFCGQFPSQQQSVGAQKVQSVAEKRDLGHIVS